MPRLNQMDASGAAIPRRRQRGPPKDDGPGLEESLQQAERRTLDFPATERAAYIRAMVSRVMELRRAGRDLDEIKEQLPEFVRDYPYLFEMVTGQEFDPANLQTMLAMLERMGQGSLSHHQATVIVGQRLASKYIRPSGGQGPPGGGAS